LARLSGRDALVWLILGVAEEGVEQQRVVYT